MAITVINYLRCSKAVQLEGDSLPRQRAAAAKYCAQHGLTITREIANEGVSAFRGKNLEFFADLVEEVQRGELAKGALILIEDFDRFSRDSTLFSIPAFYSVVSAGITVVLLNLNLVIDRKTIRDAAVMYPLMSGLSRANEESVRKSGLVRDALTAARVNRQRSSFRCPGWLRKTKAGGYEPVPEKVASLRRVFESIAGGSGCGNTAKRANAEGWLSPSARPISGWHPGFIHRVIRGRAVLGEYEFQVRNEEGKLIDSGDIVPDWYPQVIDDDLYYRANAALDSRKFGTGRHTDTLLNPLRELIACGTCGESYSLHTRAGTYPGYFCVGRYRGLCDSESVAHRRVLYSFVPPLIESWSSVFDSASVKTRYAAELAESEAELAAVAAGRANLIALAKAATIDITGVAAELQALELRHRGLTTIIAGQRAALAAVPPHLTMTANEVFHAFLDDTDTPDMAMRAEFANRVHELVEKIYVFPGAALVIVVKGLAAPLVTPLYAFHDKIDMQKYMSLWSHSMSEGAEWVGYGAEVETIPIALAPAD
jgi:DNA invertase Pin-like site-specific DNA recombinase